MARIFKKFNSHTPKVEFQMVDRQPRQPLFISEISKNVKCYTRGVRETLLTEMIERAAAAMYLVYIFI